MGCVIPILLVELVKAGIASAVAIKRGNINIFGDCIVIVVFEQQQKNGRS